MNRGLPRGRVPHWPRDDDRRRCRAPRQTLNASTNAGTYLPLHLPDRMSYAVESSEIDERRAARPYAAGQLVDRRIRPMRQKDRSGLRAQLDDVTGAIVFFVFPCSFVLLDDAVLVLVERITGGHSCLGVAVRVQVVQIHSRAPGLRQTARALSSPDIVRPRRGTRDRHAGRCPAADRFPRATRGESSADCRRRERAPLQCQRRRMERQPLEARQTDRDGQRGRVG